MGLPECSTPFPSEPDRTGIRTEFGRGCANEPLLFRLGHTRKQRNAAGATNSHGVKERTSKVSSQSTARLHRTQGDLLALRLEQYRRRRIWIGHDAEANRYYWTNHDGRYGGSALDLFTLAEQLEEHFRAGRR